ncbi:MPPD1-like protein [Mya arenaria]|uniref:MPPD1-like protein n=1 Tax=Mya arenaria TaxID=6604 RepID=A0ABY7E4X1_MYAAR|nr:MPPD1-like protein [Mya arenaria]
MLPYFKEVLSSYTETLQLLWEVDEAGSNCTVVRADNCDFCMASSDPFFKINDFTVGNPSSKGISTKERQNRNLEETVLPSPNVIFAKPQIKFVCISDTHMRLYPKDVLNIPLGDVLLHAGDFSMKGNLPEIEYFNQLLGVEHPRDLLTNCIYLQEESLDRGQPLAEKWDKIPDNVDILMTHCPPYGYGETKKGGVHFINASMCTRGYRPINPAIVFELDNPLYQPDHSIVMTANNVGYSAVSVGFFKLSGSAAWVGFNMSGSVAWCCDESKSMKPTGDCVECCDESKSMKPTGDCVERCDESKSIKLTGDCVGPCDETVSLETSGDCVEWCDQCVSPETSGYCVERCEGELASDWKKSRYFVSPHGTGSQEEESKKEATLGRPRKRTRLGEG